VPKNWISLCLDHIADQLLTTACSTNIVSGREKSFEISRCLERTCLAHGKVQAGFTCSISVHSPSASVG
jgi:hypothetical protein